MLHSKINTVLTTFLLDNFNVSLALFISFFFILELGTIAYHDLTQFHRFALRRPASAVMSTRRIGKTGAVPRAFKCPLGYARHD